MLARPWFWAGLPLMVGAAIGFSALVAPDDLGRNTRSLSEVDQVWFLGRRYGKKTGFLLGESYYAGLFLPVGIGEEALFRGAIQPAMTEWLGLWPGWAVTSIAVRRRARLQLRRPGGRGQHHAEGGAVHHRWSAR